MKRGIQGRALAVLFSILVLCSIRCVAREAWFNQRITWKYGKEGLPWKAILKEPSSQAEYQLILQPLWAVEGGIVALEIVIARPGQPDINLLEKEKTTSNIPSS